MLRNWIRAWLPGPFLPSTVIIKKLKSRDWEKEFDTEIDMYKRLSPLQGYVVPTLYGEVRLDGKRALLLEDVGGRHLGALAEGVDEYEGGYSEVEIELMLREAYEAILGLGVVPVDANLGNYVLADGRIVIVDHEQDELVEPKDNIPGIINSAVESIMDWYKYFLQQAAAERERESRVPLGRP